MMKIYLLIISALLVIILTGYTVQQTQHMRKAYQQSQAKLETIDPAYIQGRLTLLEKLYQQACEQETRLRALQGQYGKQALHALFQKWQLQARQAGIDISGISTTWADDAPAEVIGSNSTHTDLWIADWAYLLENFLQHQPTAIHRMTFEDHRIHIKWSGQEQILLNYLQALQQQPFRLKLKSWQMSTPAPMDHTQPSEKTFFLEFEWPI